MFTYIHNSQIMKPNRTFLYMVLAILAGACTPNPGSQQGSDPSFDMTWSGDQLERLAFPMGGIGAGMICLEGNGCISHVSVRHKPDVYNEPFMFGAIAVKGLKKGAKVLEGPVQEHKIFGAPHSGNGNSTSSYGYPRFGKAEFSAQFPFGTVRLQDGDIPMEVEILGWSPFIPADEDNSSLPVAALEYRFSNTADSALEMVFSYHAENFMRIRGENIWGPAYKNTGHGIKKRKNGFS